MMNDPSNKVITALYGLLNGKVSGFTVYSMPPSGVDDYILIGDYIGAEDSAKDNYMFRSSIQLEVIKTYRGQGSKAAVNTAVDTILGLVRTSFATRLTMTGFVNTVCTVESVQDFVEQDEEYHIFRKIIRFNLIIEE